MPIIISNVTIAANAPIGTAIGVLTVTDIAGSIIPCNFITTKRTGGYFAISGNNLVTSWSDSIGAGYYSVRVRANGIHVRFRASATFMISVLAAAAGGPKPTGITFQPTSACLPDNTVAGTRVATISVAMSDGSVFSGNMTAIPADTVAVSGNTQLVLARGLAPADVGSHEWTVNATQNDVTASGSIQIQVTATAPSPPPPPQPPAPAPPPPLPSSIDPNHPTVISAADVASRQASLITQLWGTSTLPTALPSVTEGVSNPFPSYNVRRVDQYDFSMQFEQTNSCYLYLASSPDLNRAVIFCPGHQYTCDWTVMSNSYRVQAVLQALLGAGYSVLAMNMPGCGDPSIHAALFAKYGDRAMSFFFEPAVQAMNYWESRSIFGQMDAVGLSGGGWMVSILPALDTRVKLSFPVAGSWPGIAMNPGFNCAAPEAGCGDTEQRWTDFYAVAGYADLFLMSSLGTGRKQFQILNYNDDCCFGNASYVAGGGPALYGVDYTTYVNNYKAAIQASPVANAFDGAIDIVATTHQISSWAQSEILTRLGAGGSPLPPPSPPPSPPISSDGSTLFPGSGGNLVTGCGDLVV